MAARRQPPRSRTLWYGAGPHFCLGFHIAQRQLHMVFSALAKLGAPITIGRRKFARNVVVAAYSEMHVRLGRSRSRPR
jgi:cytochrome P450